MKMMKIVLKKNARMISDKDQKILIIYEESLKNARTSF
jgi:hypothetical protein